MILFYFFLTHFFSEAHFEMSANFTLMKKTRHWLRVAESLSYQEKPSLKSVVFIKGDQKEFKT